LVARDLHVWGDAVGRETVQFARDPARDPGSVPVVVLRAAVGQARVAERLLAVDLLERFARHEGLVLAGDVVLELLVGVLDAGVGDGAPDALAAERRRPGGGHVHPSVAPLEDPLRVRHTEEGRGVVPGIGEPAAALAEARRVDRAAAARSV